MRSEVVPYHHVTPRRAADLDEPTDADIAKRRSGPTDVITVAFQGQLSAVRRHAGVSVALCRRTA